MKRIPFIKKKVNANTTYCKTHTIDTNWVLNQCKTLVDVAKVCEQNAVAEGLPLLKTNTNIIRQGTGKMNSPKSMCEGVIDNFNKGQYDLSDKTMKGITESFKIGAEIIDEFHEVDFYEVESLIRPKTEPVADTSGTTFSDLFSVDTITITYKRK